MRDTVAISDNNRKAALHWRRQPRRSCRGSATGDMRKTKEMCRNRRGNHWENHGKNPWLSIWLISNSSVFFWIVGNRWIQHHPRIFCYFSWSSTFVTRHNQTWQLQASQFPWRPGTFSLIFVWPPLGKWGHIFIMIFPFRMRTSATSATDWCFGTFGLYMTFHIFPIIN